MTPAKHVTEESCNERHRGTKFRLWVIFWAIAGLTTATVIAAQYSIQEAKSAATLGEDLRVQVRAMASQEEEFKQRIIKALDETRLELRSSDARLETSMSELRKGQQDLMTLLLRPNSIPKSQ